ncbi:MAG: hypothetical protein ACRDMZ_06335 [Solirubrobacteraceae bacterium]
MSRRALLVLLAASLALAASGCGGSRHAASTSPKRTLTDLHSIDQLRTAFNSASGAPRLIVLMSPT